MTKEQIMEALNQEFKSFFNSNGFKVRKSGTGMHATKEDVDLAFYIKYDCFSKHFQETESVNSVITANIPYTHYTLVHCVFQSDTAEQQPNYKALSEIFADKTFMTMINWTLPEKLDKKFV